ncbi:MAG: hypothetical protein R2831_09640 [Chitinophagaceae bacterium]
MLLLIVCNNVLLFAQSKQEKRYEIDAKRYGVSTTSKEAITAAREFKRIDSSYYVGWMLEGIYKYEHSADYLGFKLASEQLNKALLLMQKDFSKEISTRTGDVRQYIELIKYHRDWDQIAYSLSQCYSNTDELDKLWQLLQLCKKMNLQDEVFMDTYNYMSWTVHRNRFRNSSKYPFLKESIKQNEDYANSLLDSSIIKINDDSKINNTIFSSQYNNDKMPGVWHYKSILYTYQLDMKKGAEYYNKLKKTSYFPANNYATFCSIQGDFAQAEAFYEMAKKEYSSEKHMKESYYYSSVINSYKNENKKGIEELKNLITSNGSTPGFGWYNIAVARTLLYDGQLPIAERYIQNAENFKEIHIGTTLGQSHYDFTVNLLKLIAKKREIKRIFFEQKKWYLSPSAWFKLAKKQIEKFTLQFLIINQFAQNPEREQVIYKLFSTESTVSFDEIYELIEGFSTNFFIKKFEEELALEKRNNIKRYYKLFLAKLLIKKGKKHEAHQWLKAILNDPTLNKDYEKLLLARTYEALIICTEGNTSEKKTFIQKMYSIYPQLLPYNNQKIKVKITTNASSELEQKIIKDLSNFRIQIVSQNQDVDLNVEFSQLGNVPTISVRTNCLKEEIVRPFLFSYKNPKDASKQIAYGIFNIGNADKKINMEE